jgi:hypothetical protein
LPGGLPTEADWLNSAAQIYSPDPDHPEAAWEVMIDCRGVVVECSDGASVLAVWDLANDHLEKVERRNWRDATLLAWQAGVGWQRRADRLAASHGTTVDELRNAQEA